MKKILIFAVMALLFVGCNQPTPENTPITTSVPTPTPIPTIEPHMDTIESDIHFTWDFSLLIRYTGHEQVDYYKVSMDGNPRRTYTHRLFTGKNAEDRLIEEMKIQAYDANDNLLDEAVFHNVYFFDFKNHAVISDITSEYPQIERLFLFNMDSIDISYISNLKNLKQLCINELNLSFLAKYKTLKKLEIWSSYDDYFQNIDALSKLTNLEYLYLNGYDGDNVDALSSLNKIESLTLCNYTGTNIDGISHLINLEDLLISDYQGKSLLSLEKLTNLKKLSLINMSNVTDITPISNLINIESLRLDELEKVINIDAIGSMDKLEYLRLYNMSNIRNSNALINLSNLKEVYIEGSVFNLQPISLARSIEIISCGYTTIKNIESISNLTKLKYLTLHLGEDCEFENVDWLSNLVNLETLSINNDINITDLSCLEELKHLEHLSIYGNNPNLKILKSLDTLETLTIRINDNRDFKFIADMNNLIELSITYGGNFPNLIGKLKSLRKITIREGNGAIINLEPLFDLENLVSLSIPWIEYMKVDLSPIGKMTQLEELLIDCNNSTELPDLSGLNSLRKLEIYQSYDILNFESIWENTSVEYLYIRDSSLDNISSIVNMPDLKNITLFNTGITVYTPLLNLTNLEKLAIGFPSVDEKRLAYFYNVEGLEVEIR